MRFTGHRAASAFTVLALSVGLIGAADGVKATADKLGPRPLDRSIVLAPGRALIPSPLPIVEGDIWSYKKGTAEPPADWATVSFDDASWPIGPSGFGYGDDDDATLLTDMLDAYSTVYTRRTFTANPSSVGGLELTVDYDDGFIVYLNGTEVARRRAPGVIGEPAPYTAVATDSHEASAGANGNPAEVIDISAYTNLLVAGTNVLAVQGLNAGLGSGDLSLIVELRSANAAPYAPHDPLPASGGTGASTNAQLCATVSDPNLDPLQVTFFGREAPDGPSPPFTIVAVPDTQFYAAYYPGSYLAQTQWIVDNKESRNIAYVSHLGDCVDDASDVAQWITADSAWDLVEDPATTGLSDGIPYGISVGNHDQSPVDDPGTVSNPASSTTLYNSWFGVGRFQGRGYYGGSFGSNNDNHYELFSASGMNFIAISMEYMPSNSALRQNVLAWADALLETHANRRAIVTSHYLMEGGASNDFSNQGLATWNALKNNHNLFLMLCGHLDTAKDRTDTFVDGTGTTTTHTLRSDYQFQPNGGNGWLRIMTFSPATDTIDVVTYSPTLNDNLTDADNQFTLSYDMIGGLPFAAINNVPIQVSGYPPSGQQVCTTWVGLQPNRQYEWYVVASDGVAGTTGPHWSFQTAATCVGNGACDDANPCTLDSCDTVAGTCLNLPVSAGTACLDGNVCNGSEACNASGQCVAGSPLSCSDGNHCNGTESCDAVAGCQAGTPLDCSDALACTVDSCDPATGCQNVSACGPGAVCTSGGCLSGCLSDAACDDAEPCTSDVCDLPNTHSLTFDGVDDYVTMGEAPQLNAAEFTVELWFKRTGVGVTTGTGGGGFTAVPLVAKGSGESESATLNMNYFLGLVETTPGTWVLGADFEEGAGGAGPLGQNHPVVGATPVPFGQWHHAAATYDGISWKLYLDGSLDATATVEQPAASDSVQHFGLGTSLSSTGTQRGRYQGLLDEVRVWSYARTAEQIATNRDRQIETEDNLLGRWSLNEGAGTTATDTAATPTQENGTIMNGSSWSADAAVLDSGTCTHAPDPTCCTQDAQCADANTCTLDSCDVTGHCAHAAIPGCCAQDSDCADANTCTTDSCNAGQCTHAPVPNCCTQGAACDDGTTCTIDSCNAATTAAVSLDGTSSRVAMGQAPSLGTATFTLECWFRWNDGGSTASSGGGGVVAYPLVTKGRGESDANNRDANYFFGVDANGRLTADFEEGAGQLSPGANHPITGSTAIARNDGVWHHAAASFDGTTWRLYLDGNPDGLVVVGPNRLPRSNSIQHFGVGTALNSLGETVDSVGAVNGYFSGDIDEVRVWDHALSQAEIQTNKNRQLTAGSGLLGRWGFNDATGTLAADSTSAGNDGFFEYGTWLTTGLPPVGTNTCEHAAVADTTACSDGNACTTNDACSGGVCVGGAAPICDDGNVCTADACVPASGCAHPPVSCNDGNACTADSCVPASGCIHAPVVCNDGNSCNGVETCNAASGCVAGTPPECDDGNVCTIDTCNPSSGCVFTNNSTACNDGNSCNGVETCDAVSGCVAGTPPECDDGNVCTIDTCNPSSGCVFTNNTAACNDGNPCTTDTCDPEFGCATTTNTGACDDGNPATCGETCSGGVCDGGVPVAAPDPVNDSVRVGKTAAEAAVSWTDAPGPYNVYRGVNGAGVAWTYDQTCFVTNAPGTFVNDGAIPPTNKLFYYLVSRISSCRESALGQASSGNSVPNTTPCGVAP